MLADDSPHSDPVRGAGAPRDVAEALRTAGACLDYLNSPAAGDLDGRACGEVLAALGAIQAKLAAARASLRRRFDAANAHDGDGYGSSSAWLAAKARMSRRDARAAVRQMRLLSERSRLADALAAGTITESWAAQLAAWTRGLPAGLRAETDRILLEAAAAGASLDDLATIAGLAIEKWRSQSPDPDDDGTDFKDRCLRVGSTFGGAGVIRGDLTPECAAAVTAVLEALGKRRGPEDDRSEGQRFRPAAATDVHHIRHQSDGGATSVGNCALFCEFHHETCIHRWGWEIILHPDGTMEARSPDGTQVLRRHPPPDARAA